MTPLPFQRVSINGFRGLKNLVLEEMGAVNVLVGGNNSGKTSVLEALSLACNPFDPTELLAVIRRRDFGGLDETKIQSLRWCFTQSGDLTDPDVLFRGRCEIDVSGDFKLRELLVEYKDVVGFPSEIERERIDKYLHQRDNELDFNEPWRGAEVVNKLFLYMPEEHKESDDVALNIGHESVALPIWEYNNMIINDTTMIRRPTRKPISLPCETLTPYSYQLNRLQVRAHSRQLFAREGDSLRGKKRVLDLIQQFDPDIVDIQIASFRGGRPAMYLNHAKLGPAPITIFGDALRRAVLLANTLPMLKGGLLLIDEVETGIHTSALERVFKWLVKAAKDFDVQIVATTHSLEAVDSMMQAAAENDEDLVTYHLDNEPERTVAKRISGELLRRLREKRGLDVR